MEIFMNFRITSLLICQLFLIFFNNSIFAQSNDNNYKSEHLKKISRTNHSFLISPRIGLDSITGSGGGYFLSAGADFIWKPTVINGNIELIPELGVKFLTSIHNMSNKNINRIMNTYAFIGLQTPKNKDFFTSIRFLTGNEMIELFNPDRKTNQLTFGGELLLGYQLINGYELYGTIGVTQNTQLMAINLAINI
jgi:hypothetical protein